MHPRRVETMVEMKTVSPGAQTTALRDQTLIEIDTRKGKIYYYYYYYYYIIIIILLARKRGEHLYFMDRVSPEKFWYDSSSLYRQLRQGPQEHKNPVSALSQNPHIYALFLEASVILPTW